jgi:3-hydroxy-9,10-secoandrosta-1,3,5(10)-triene-9,17-dione monooxygenase
MNGVAPMADKAPDFSDVTLAEANERARSLIPLLAREAQAAEANRGMLPSTLTALQEHGLIRMLQPKRWGGMELDFTAHFDVPDWLAQGDASAAWTVGNLAIHHWMLALYDPRAQEEVWGDDPQALIAGGIAFPQGRARKVDGGVMLSGRWSFSSGVDLCGWNMLAAIIREDDKPVDYRMCLVPRREYTIIDDWYTLGLCASGSKTVTCEEVFVPEHRALSMLNARGGGAFPGASVNPNPIYRISLAALGQHTIAAVITGNTQALIDEAVVTVKERSTSYTSSRMRDFPLVQARVAAAAARIEMARTVLRHDCAQAQAEAAATMAMPSDEVKLRYRRNAALAVRLATEAADLVFEMMGANGIYDRSALQRRLRDTRAGAAHISLNWDAQMASFGLAALGGDVKMPTL